MNYASPQLHRAFIWEDTTQEHLEEGTDVPPLEQPLREVPETWEVAQGKNPSLWKMGARRSWEQTGRLPCVLQPKIAEMVEAR